MLIPSSEKSHFSKPLSVYDWTTRIHTIEFAARANTWNVSYTQCIGLISAPLVDNITIFFKTSFNRYYS